MVEIPSSGKKMETGRFSDMVNFYQPYTVSSQMKVLQPQWSSASNLQISMDCFSLFPPYDGGKCKAAPVIQTVCHGTV